MEKWITYTYQTKAIKVINKKKNCTWYKFCDYRILKKKYKILKCKIHITCIITSKYI